MNRRTVGRLDGWTVGMLAIVLSNSPTVRLSAQEPFPTRPPAPSRLRPVRFPPFREVALPNGMTLLLVENHEQPALSVSLSFRAGTVYDPAGKEGVAAIVAKLITKGTTTRDAEQIAAAIEGVGGSIGASAGDDFLTVSADVLSDHADLAFTLLGDVTQRATFPDQELYLARTRFLSALEVELSQADNVAARAFQKEIYGRNPYGRNTSGGSYRAITRNDVVAFAGRRLRPGGSLLVVAGDITLPRARELATQAFGSWRGAAAPAPVFPAAPAKRGTDILLVNRPGSVQSNIVIGNTTFLPTDTGYYAARIATHVLGGGSDSRLFMILREQKSWTYGSYAALRRNRDRKSTRLNSSHPSISYAVCCLKKKNPSVREPRRASARVGPHSPNALTDGSPRLARYNADCDSAESLRRACCTSLEAVGAALPC